MILKNALTGKFRAAAVCAGLLLWGGPSFAAQGQNQDQTQGQPGEYRPSEFLGLDLSKAVLSPKPLGPPTQFAPVPIEADSGSATAAAPTEQQAAAGSRVRSHRVAVRAEKPRGAARTRLARRHSNPLDAEAFDTRIQTWPCKTGGICNWQRQ